jgi:hypothetical protein
MANIWSNVGNDLSPRGEEWLYRVGGEIHGPVPKQVIVDKLIKGELTVKSHVAREGGDFHPIGEVAAFEASLEEVKRALAKRAASKTRKVVVLAILALGAIGGGVGVFLKKQMEEKAKENAIAAEAKKKELDAAAGEAEELIKGTKTELVALVSLGDISEMKVGSEKKPSSSPGTKSKPGTAPGTTTSGNLEMASCARSQTEIFGVLGKHLAKINVCVQDEKARDTQGLLPSTLPLEFVVRPDGKVVDFEIGHRAYRTGPMKNCMLKAFQLIKFDTAGGSNCPVEIPIKIGG